MLDDFITEFRQFVLTPLGSPRCQIHPAVGNQIILFDRVVDEASFAPIDKPNPAVKEVLDSDNRVVTVKFDWEGIAATARIELLTEYFSVTTFAELRPVSDIMAEYRMLKDYLKEFNEQTADNNSNEETARASAAKAEQLRKFLFYEFWDERVGRMFDDEGLQRSLNEGLFNNLFADFRGLVVSDETCKLSKPPDFGQSKELPWGKEIDGRFLPLFSEIKDYECAASYMLGGRAMHMTTLGPQLPEADASELLPLQYIVYVQQSDHDVAGRAVVSKWQLGRLVDDLHFLGTVRLAALKYLPELREAVTRLSWLDGYVKKARDDLTGGISQPDLHDAHVQLDNIKTQFNKATRTDTGILYRIERARYYIEQFNAHIGGLRLRRLDGYQRYDEFIRHRLGPVFDFINRLGVRYERAESTLSLFDQNNLSTRTQHIQEGMSKGQEEIKKIQVYGEAVLWAALVPYYLTALADHVMVHGVVMWIAFGVFALGVGYATFRIADFKKVRLAGRIVAVCGTWLVLGLILLVLYTHGAIKFDDATSANVPPAGTANPPVTKTP